MSFGGWDIEKFESIGPTDSYYRYYYSSNSLNGSGREVLKKYDPLKELSCKEKDNDICCQAALVRFHDGKVICCYINGCYPKSCKDCVSPYFERNGVKPKY